MKMYKNIILDLFEAQFCRNIVQLCHFFLLIEQFMQFGPVDWPFSPNVFECMKSVWPFMKISDWPFLRNTVDIPEKLNITEIIFASGKLHLWVISHACPDFVK